MMMSRSDGQAECGLSPMCSGEPERAFEQGSGLIDQSLQEERDSWQPGTDSPLTPSEAPCAKRESGIVC